jgi:hypothetical protein
MGMIVWLFQVAITPREPARTPGFCGDILSLFEAPRPDFRRPLDRINGADTASASLQVARRRPRPMGDRA